MSRCQFTIQYFNYELHKWDHFDCNDKEPLASGFCIFHDKDYLHDKINNEEHKSKILGRLKHKVNQAISNKEPLLCIGFLLPEFNLSDLSSNKVFTKSVYFSGSKFFGRANFVGANFQGKSDFSKAEFEVADFVEAKFHEAYFSKAEFQEKTNFGSS